ncbi:hypothetical protein ACQR1Y_18905 [Bradyrhizobium sp. HKCCYLRH3099]
MHVPPPQTNAAELGSRSFVPPTERQVNIWIPGNTQKTPLELGQAYPLSFMVGKPLSDSITQGIEAAIGSNDVPKGGLQTEWLVVARGAELAPGTPGTQVALSNPDNMLTWSCRFRLLIPETGDSHSVQLKVTPTETSPAIDVIVYALNQRGSSELAELYRQFKIVLNTRQTIGATAVEPARIVDEQMPTATAHVGIRPAHEWTTPVEVLDIVVIGSQAAVIGVAGNKHINSIEPWWGVPAQVGGSIDNIRKAAEVLRARFERHLDDIDPGDLTDRLKRWAKREGGPEYNWSLLGNYADPSHQTEWERIAVSQELRMLAYCGRRLFQAFFPGQSNLSRWLTALRAGSRLNISWTAQAGAGFVPHVPWGLMYTGDVPAEGRPVDPMGFLGLRCRIAYTAHATESASRALGSLDGTHRAHFLYWGDDLKDVTAKEARWQRERWCALNNQVFVPHDFSDPKAELLYLLNDPQPSPTSVLYFFCQCNIGDGSNPILRFGSTNDPANIVVQSDVGTSALVDRPLVFANACTTVAADPFMANDLENAFFERGCRAFIGTETKVPIVFASRFAEIFFQFFYRLLDPSPMAAGEAIAQTRLFLWTHYRNLGGLFYGCINQFDLFIANEDEIVALRG